MRYLANVKEGSMFFHPAIFGPGLYPTDEAPKQFLCWLEQLIQDWDFENIATAHNGVLVGGAKEKLIETMKRYEPRLTKMSKKRAQDVGSWTPEWKNTCECG
jgi:hypothetical protein